MRLRWAAAVLAMPLVACGGGGEEATGRAVGIRLIAFRPESVSVTAGTRVTWTNNDVAVHTVTSEGFDSGELAKDETFAHTFAKPGTFTYLCNIHPATMRGEVRVS